MEISKKGKKILDRHRSENLYRSELSFFGKKVVLLTNLKDFCDEFNSSFSHMIKEADEKGNGKDFYLFKEDDGSFNLVLPTLQNLNFEGREILFPLFTSLMNSFVLPETKDMLIFHSAAVALNDRGIIIPGEEASGKTTLTATLLERGFTYLSDEYAGLDYSEINLHSFPKSLFMRKPSIELFNGKRKVIEKCAVYSYRNEKRWIVDPADVFDAKIGKKAEPEFVIFLNPNYGGKSSIKEIPSYEVLTRILVTSRNSVYFSNEERKVFFEKVLALVKKTAGFELTVGIPDDASAILYELVMNKKGNKFDESSELEMVADRVRLMI